MRLVGIFMMAVSVTGVGWLMEERTKERLNLLRQLRRMISYLKSQIQYSNAELPEAVEMTALYLGGTEGKSGSGWNPGEFLIRVSGALQEKQRHTFADIWQEEVRRIPDRVVLSQKDRQSLMSLGANLGYADREFQDRELLQYLKQLDENIDEAKCEAESVGRLYRTLGVTAGAFLVILLL